MNLVYKGFLGSPPWKGKDIFDSSKIHFDTRKNPRIQAADLVARETMKFLDNYNGPVRRPERRSLKVLAGPRIQFAAYEGPYFKDCREKLPELAMRTRMKDHDYRDWLLKSNLTDNDSNRLRFIIWLDETDPLT